mmetsp:Transcript_12738/g.12844  ORF Transcript_12738/g.12844 Transcript_12738/m.12844 type:complete len:82 (+) Transcript_12738:314-559(+)
MSLDPTEQEMKRLSVLVIQILLGDNDAAAAIEMVQQPSTSASVTSLNSRKHPSFEPASSYNNVSRSTYLGEPDHSSLQVHH